MTYGKKVINSVNLGMLVVVLIGAFFIYERFTMPFGNSNFVKWGTVLTWILIFFSSTQGATQFKIKAGNFVIKSYMRPWINCTYVFSEIENMQIMDKFEGAKLLVRTKDGKKRSFYSRLLGDAEWKNLAAELNGRGFNLVYN